MKSGPGFLFLLAALAASAVACAAAAVPLPQGYVLRDSVVVPSGVPGAFARVEVLQDERLTPALGDSIWGRGLDIICAADSLPEPWASLCASPLRPALVRVIVRDRVADAWPTDREQARLAVEHLYPGDRPTVLVTVDHTIGWGSYAGLATEFLEMRAGRAQWLRATDARTGRADTIWVASALKKMWRLLPLKSGGKDILLAECQPDFDRWDKAAAQGKEDSSFLLVYTRYHFDGRRWVKRTRTEPGYIDFESDEFFPALGKFPP